MRLYEVILTPEEKEEAYLPTLETYRDIAAFRAKVRANGSIYQGRKWILLPEGKNEPKVMTIQPSHQHEIVWED